MARTTFQALFGWKQKLLEIGNKNSEKKKGNKWGITQKPFIVECYWHNLAITIQYAIQLQNIIEISSFIKRYCGYS